MTAPTLLLALHSSSETLAVAVQPLGTAEPPAPPACFPLGRALSNALLPCLEQVLPAERWPEIGRLVVATGPGGFTGTRLTVVLARTLAQQLQCPLHGFSSFLLMARRLAQPGAAMQAQPRFWLAQELLRRGTVAGCYGPNPAALGGVAELELPRLFRPTEPWPGAPEGPEPSCAALVDPAEDALQLLQLGQLAHAQALPGPWQPVLPIYPTSPVEGL
ncbi:MAG: tRNA (adenosine(37)-N6)-threonylcarbamoyltransferase complex dimerization subunit type 1 TsaB [Cyanobacteria bacterium M_surface_10_m2_179]|nr:tRNA (adenosine(37)-N6)-threonylcarbamoyltransferase complex dimerization subunit type 1 TsaB [Cyanobacteria bacterium M_surface_10_m2_179]